MTRKTTKLPYILGGQFTVENLGQFAVELVGHIKMEKVGHIACNIQATQLSAKKQYKTYLRKI